MYYSRVKESPTLIVGQATWFKQATMGAAVDLPGAKKAQLGRLVYVRGDEVPIYGIPEMLMAITRSADRNNTPDVRTRAIFPSWASYIEVEFVEPILTKEIISKMVAAAGITQGVGDWRVEKGSGNYGQYSVVDGDHPMLKVLMGADTRKVQRDALDNPVPYNSETESLLDWFNEEVTRRGFKDSGKKLKIAASK